MAFPIDDEYWVQARTFLEQHARSLDAILAPNEFLEFFPGNYHYSISYRLPAQHFDYVVFHKAMLADIEPSLVIEVLQRFYPVFGNEVFVIYAKTPIPDLPPPDNVHIQPLLNEFNLEEQVAEQLLPGKPRSAAVITTYNRPQCLERSLPQILALGIPVVIIDDGSLPALHQANQRLADKYRVPLLYFPENRGLPNAVNTGVGYWLADPDIEWISYFQDDVDVQPETLTVLAQVQDPKERPLLTGRDASEHPTFQTETIAGYKVLFKRSMPGVHLHAHRDYWASVLPIPTPYLGAPKPDQGKPGQGADEDWWITAWSPNSIVKRGGYVVCVPGLVSTFDLAGNQSTWHNVITPSGPSESDGLSLEGVKVLVDGYNLQLTKGTGIKTYGLSLIQALDVLGANVDVLLSRNGYKTNEILDEVIFFDNQSGNQSIFNLLKWIIKTSSPFYRARRRKTPAGFVVKRGKYTDDFLRYTTSFNLPQCYDFANVLYNKLKITTQVRVPEKIDIWHATYPLPMRVQGAKKITTVHDLIPLRLPYATLDDKERFYFKVRDALKDSAVVITVSENSKKDLLTYFDADPDRIIVTYQPIALDSLDASDEEVSFFLKQYGLTHQNYLLFVGAIEPKKNVGRLLDAYATLDTDMPLVIVGKKGWLWDEELGKTSYLFDDKESKKKVKLLEYVSKDSLRFLYKGAYCLVFPSLYEGFGLPPLEAMNFGCPVITSNVSCLPEICGDAALYVDPYSVRDIKQKLEEVLGSPELRHQLVKAGYQNAQSFDMDHYVSRLHQAYTKALG
jgi:glycosyltransferase involved in cell wall biosynthesis